LALPDAQRLRPQEQVEILKNLVRKAIFACGKPCRHSRYQETQTDAPEPQERPLFALRKVLLVSARESFLNVLLKKPESAATSFIWVNGRIEATAELPSSEVALTSQLQKWCDAVSDHLCWE
jgi:hypothetical protein